LRPRPGTRARRSPCLRPKGSGEAESAPEAKGVGRDGVRTRGQRGRAFLLLLFVAFYPLSLGILFYGTQHPPSRRRRPSPPFPKQCQSNAAFSFSLSLFLAMLSSAAGTSLLRKRCGRRSPLRHPARIWPHPWRAPPGGMKVTRGGTTTSR